jgi:hypothetical protein
VSGPARWDTSTRNWHVWLLRRYWNARTFPTIAGLAETGPRPSAAAYQHSLWKLRRQPATLTGVNGRPTRACMLPIDTRRPLRGSHSAKARAPQAKTTVARNACLTLTCVIATASAYRDNDKRRVIDLDQSPHWPDDETTVHRGTTILRINSQGRCPFIRLRSATPSKSREKRTKKAADGNRRARPGCYCTR